MATGIFSNAREQPGKDALVAGDRRITFGELDHRVNRCARSMQRRGVKAGDRVAVALRNRPEFLECAAAAARLGAQVVPVSWRYKADEVRYMVEDSRARLIVAESRETIAGLPALHLEEYEAALAREDDSPVGDGDAATVFRYYTSGTTGQPKAVEREGSDPQATIERGRAYLTVYGVLASDDVHLACGPLYHTAPCAFASYALLFGQTVVVTERFDAGECLALIGRERVTWTHMVPINFVRILALPDPRRYDLSSIRRILHAAAPCPVDVKRRIMDLFPPGAVLEYYGATEGLATMITGEEWLAKPGSVGRAFPGFAVKVLDDEGNELPAGEVGVVYVSPADGARFVYAGAPEKTAAAWRGDLYTVGDMGYLDEDGYLFLTDRKIDMIITGGANVYPAEVEAVLYRHPAVGDVTVIGVPDDEWGERVHALVEPRAPVPADELIAFCRHNLATYKCPRTVEFTEEMPRDDNGKVRKRELRDRYWAGRARKI